MARFFWTKFRWITLYICLKGFTNYLFVFPIDLKPELNYGKISDMCVVCFGVFSMTVNFSLLVGICMRKPLIIKVFLYSSFLYIVFLAIFAVTMIFWYPLFAIGLIFLEFLTIYCFLCINSYYFKLKCVNDLTKMI